MAPWGHADPGRARRGGNACIFDSYSRCWWWQASSASPPTRTPAAGSSARSTQPVNQAAERIIFAEHDDGTVTAVVQIQYQGPAEQFSWVLPVPGTPEVGVSSNAAFTALQNASNPQYILNQTVEGTCGGGGRRFFGGFRR